MSSPEFNGDPATSRWHLDKRVNPAMVGSLFIVFGGAFWWGSDLDARVYAMERIVERVAEQQGLVIQLQTQMAQVQRQVTQFQKPGARWSLDQHNAYASVQDQRHDGHDRRDKAQEEETARLKQEVRTLREDLRDALRRVRALEADKS